MAIEHRARTRPSAAQLQIIVSNPPLMKMHQTLQSQSSSNLQRDCIVLASSSPFSGTDRNLGEVTVEGKIK
jgi:hypothetical protein